MFAAFYSWLGDVFVIEQALRGIPEIENLLIEEQCKFVGVFDDVIDAKTGAQWALFNHIGEIEMECYLNGELNYD